ncbi:MAG: cyclic nucleotide-binding domain-containing protein [Oligoflexales bacterium]
MSDEQTSFVKGSTIFSQGDHGGSVYIIEQGTMEIFITEDHQDIVLATLNPGELVGLLTCLTGGKRLASARAKTDIIARYITSDQFKKLVQGLPNWVGIVMKECTLRLSQMNDQYVKSLQDAKINRGKMLTKSLVAIQMAYSLSNLSELHTLDLDDGRCVVLIPDVLARIQVLTGYPEEIIEEIKEVFVQQGLIKTEKEPDKHREVCEISQIQKLDWFASFFKSCEYGKNKKLLQVSFTNKQKMTLMKMRNYAQESGLDESAMSLYLLEDLRKDFEKKVGEVFDESVFDLIEPYLLAQKVTHEDQPAISINATTVLRTLVSIQVIRKIGLDTIQM